MNNYAIFKHAKTQKKIQPQKIRFFKKIQHCNFKII